VFSFPFLSLSLSSFPFNQAVAVSTTSGSRSRFLAGQISKKMVCIRQATMEDLLAMQRCNLLCLPENYQLKVR